jgi:acetoin utilization deacetylase AcuC-like enzyme
MVRTLSFSVLYSPIFLEHKPPQYHPENPGRLLKAVESLKKTDLWRNVSEPTPVQ